MRRLFRAVGLIVVAAGLALSPRAHAAPVHVSILHFNDAYDIAPASGEGGWAEAATLIRAERARQINTVVTYGGDLISPSFMSSLTQGQQMIALMNQIGVDYAAFGSHDFDFGPEVLAERIGESKFVWLATNTRDAAGKPFAGVPPIAIRRVGPATLGFFALLTPGTATESSPGPGIIFLPPESAAAEAVKTLRAAGVDVVIALTHESLAADQALASAVSGIDLILGGDEQGAVATQEHGVPILKGGLNAETIVSVDLAIDKPASGPLQLSTRYRLLPTSGVKPNAAVAARIATYKEEFDQRLAEPVATLSTELDSRLATVRGAESSMGDVIADAMLDATHADAAIMNGGGIRGNRLYAAGSILMRKDIHRELPFANTVVLIELSGSALLRALENGVSQVAQQVGRFPQIAGLSFSFDPGKPAGKRVSKAMIAGVPVDPKKLYKLATNDYLARGGDGYESLRDAKRLAVEVGGRGLAEIVVDYLKAKGEIAVVPGERIRKVE
jgi:5'-nucleotidase / UDP-sugar diphosphatase